MMEVLSFLKSASGFRLTLRLSGQPLISLSLVDGSIQMAMKFLVRIDHSI